VARSDDFAFHGKSRRRGGDRVFRRYYPQHSSFLERQQIPVAASPSLSLSLIPDRLKSDAVE